MKVFLFKVVSLVALGFCFFQINARIATSTDATQKTDLALKQFNELSGNVRQLMLTCDAEIFYFGGVAAFVLVALMLLYGDVQRAAVCCFRPRKCCGGTCDAPKKN